MPPFRDLTGQQFGRLTVVRRHGSMHGKAAWLCLCACGNEHAVPSGSLIRGGTTSCGCWRRERSAQSPCPGRKCDTGWHISASQITGVVHQVTSASTVKTSLPNGHTTTLTPNEITEISLHGHELAFSLDIHRYVPRCQPCHRRFDNKLTQSA